MEGTADNQGQNCGDPQITAEGTIENCRDQWKGIMETHGNLWKGLWRPTEVLVTIGCP